MKIKRVTAGVLAALLAMQIVVSGLSVPTYAKETDSEPGVEEPIEEPVEEPVQEEEPQQPVKPQKPKVTVSADYAVLYNVESGEMLFEKNAKKRTPTASTAKLMTAVAACHLFKENATFRVGKELNLVSWDASRAGLKKGNRLSFSQIMSALLLPSGCDAAYTIAVKGGRKLAGNAKLSPKKAVAHFEQYANRLAKKLGLVNSHFVNPDGYDAKNQYSCARDMAILAKEALRQPRIYRVTKKASVKVKLLRGGWRNWTNTNAHLNKKSPYYIKECIGLKTGTTSKAGACLVSAVRKAGQVYVCVIMHTQKDKRFADSYRLLHYAMKYGIN
ncbi:MAG: D-alanyl-D-alanine carboxypeptidase [Lachnospiraceae bacterium]|nr:D-alanyl-D-alanine carboxypeptidase [Lachnospiraceae bacterium]